MVTGLDLLVVIGSIRSAVPVGLLVIVSMGISVLAVVGLCFYLISYTDENGG